MSFKIVVTALRRRVLLFMGVFSVGMAGSLWLAPPSYESAARVLVRSLKDEVGFAVEEGGAKKTLVDDDEVYRFAAALWQDGDARRIEEAGDSTLSAPATWLRRKVTMEATVDPSSPVTVVARGHDRHEVVRMANTVAKAFERVGEVRARRILERLRADVKARGEAATAALEKAKLDIGRPPEEVRDLQRQRRELLQAVDSLERQIEEAETAKRRGQERRRRLVSFRESIGQDDLQSSLTEYLKSQISSIKVDLAVRNVAGTPQDPEVKRYEARLGHLERELEREQQRVRESEISRLDRAEKEVDLELAELEERRLLRLTEFMEIENILKKMVPIEQQMEVLEKDLAAASAEAARIQTALRLRASLFRIDHGARLEGVREGARFVGPLGVAALGLSLLLAASAVGLRAWFDAGKNAVHWDVRHLGLATIGRIQRLPVSETPWIAKRAPTDLVSDAFGIMATLVHRSLSASQKRSVMVTSAVSKEGRTTVAVNLAVALARKGFRTVLVDADLRGSSVHAAFGLDNSRGLSTVIESPSSISALGDLLKQTEVENLWVLTAGPRPNNPQRLLESPAMFDVVRRLTESYDRVVFDSSPVVHTSDPLTLATLAESVLLVVGAGVADRPALLWARNLLEGVKAHVMGVVVNDARP